MYHFITACDISKLILHEKIEFRRGLRAGHNVGREEGEILLRGWSQVKGRELTLQ